MNKSLLWLASGLLLSHQLALAQSRPKPSTPAAQYGIGGAAAPAANLMKFDLDFPGGSPGELVRAIEKASGKPLNVIVPAKFNDVAIPALKMKGVDVSQLFNALQASSVQTVVYVSGSTQMGFGRGGIPQHSTAVTSYGFRNTSGELTDDTIWYFFREEPPLPNIELPRVCRFWQLAPHLETLKIEDITTAIQTGFKMLDEAPPVMNFHQDTKLLIAVAEEDKLKLIDSVLAELGRDVKASKPGLPARATSPVESGRR